MVLLALTTLLVAAIVGWALHLAWTALAEIDKSAAEFDDLGVKFKVQVGMDAKLLEDMQKQYSGVANHVTKALDEANESLVTFAMGNAQQELTNFWAKSLDLKIWLRDQEPLVNQGKLILNTPSATFNANVKQCVLDIERAYDAYLASAREFTDSAATTNAPDARLKQFAAVQSNLQRVLVLANRANVQAEAIKLSQFSSKHWFPKGGKLLSTFIPELNRQLTNVHRRLILASVASAIGLLGALVVLTYRVWVSPLRLKLRESDATIERQQKLAQKGQTAAELAHEIRNPLAAINFRLYALQKALSGTGEEHRDAAAIRKDIRRLNAILEDFLQLDQSPRPDFISMSAEDALREARDLMAPQLESQQIHMKLETDGDTQLQADPHLVQQVLINLIKNAAESIGRDGAITLLARKDNVELRRRPTDVVAIEVHDTGPGIPADVQERLFDPFFTTKKGGTGLGLSIVERIVEKHGGVLDFETKIGKGTKFRIMLPVERDI